MADETPRKRPGPVLWITIVLAVLLIGAIGFILMQGARSPAESTPATPELGPDTAQATPQTAPAPTLADATVQPAQVIDQPPTAGGDFVFEDESLSFKVDMPDGAPNDPMLRWLRRDAEGYLSSRKANARADFNRLKKSGVKPMPWEVKIKWDYTAKAGDIVSLLGVSDEYTGGAHPIQHFDTLIVRPDTGKKLGIGDMVTLDRSPSPAMMIAICEALKAAKMKRIKSATIMDEPIVCAGANANAKTDEAKLALAPSNQPGKFGGIYAYYEPYAVGAYAEGPYKLTVQQEIFAQDLKPGFKALFGGEAPVIEN